VKRSYQDQPRVAIPSAEEMPVLLEEMCRMKLSELSKRYSRQRWMPRSNAYDINGNHLTPKWDIEMGTIVCARLPRIAGQSNPETTGAGRSLSIRGVAAASATTSKC